MRHGSLARLFGLAVDDCGVEPGMLLVDLGFLRLTVVQVVDRGEHRVQQQVGERAQGLDQHRVVRGFADGQVEGVIEARMGAGLQRLLVGGDQRLVAAFDQYEVGLGAAQRGQPGRLALQQRAHFKQVIQGAWLRAEQVHQR